MAWILVALRYACFAALYGGVVTVNDSSPHESLPGLHCASICVWELSKLQKFTNFPVVTVNDSSSD